MVATEFLTQDPCPAGLPETIPLANVWMYPRSFRCAFGCPLQLLCWHALLPWLRQKACAGRRLFHVGYSDDISAQALHFSRVCFRRASRIDAHVDLLALSGCFFANLNVKEVQPLHTSSMFYKCKGALGSRPSGRDPSGRSSLGFGSSQRAQYGLIEEDTLYITQRSLICFKVHSLIKLCWALWVPLVTILATWVWTSNSRAVITRAPTTRTTQLLKIAIYQRC